MFWINPLIGGIIIGIAVSIMLLWNGRVTGISGIVYGLFNLTKNDIIWRILFVFGLISGGLLMKSINPLVFSGTLPTDDNTVVIAGLFVGFGTVLGSGCTSGHGVCGISRLSIRSIIATLIFIFSGIYAVFIFRKYGVII